MPRVPGPSPWPFSQDQCARAGVTDGGARPRTRAVETAPRSTARRASASRLPPVAGCSGTACQPVTGRAAFTTDGDGATAALTSDLGSPLPLSSPPLSFLDLESPSLSSFDDLPSLSSPTD